jgi:integrase
METFILQMIEKHAMNDRCAGNVFGYLNQAFEYGRRSKYLTENPMDLIDKKLLLSRCINPPEKGDEERILTKAEIRALQKAISDHQSKIPGYMPDYAIRLALFTGMRIGELAALKWSCVDDMYIHIDFSEHRLDYNGRRSDIVVGEPKSRKHRLIPITKDIRSLLDEIRSASIHYDENGCVFTNEFGDRCTAGIIGNATTKRFKEAGIAHGSIHRIRRTVSSMLNQFLPQKDVSALLGHTETVNEMYYNYSTADTKEKASALSQLSSNIIHLTNFPQRKKA